MDLAKSLSEDVSHLHELWRQRDKLSTDQANLQSQKDQAGDALFQSEFDQQFEDDFNQVVRNLDKANATQDACNRNWNKRSKPYTLSSLSQPIHSSGFSNLSNKPLMSLTSTHSLEFSTLTP